MRIGFFTPSWPGERVANGITTATASVVEGLHGLGHEAYIVTSDKENDDPFAWQLPPLSSLGLVDKVKVRFGAIVPHYRNFANQIAQGVNDLVRDNGLDVFLMEESFGWAGFVQERVDIPVGVVLHGPHFIHKEVMPLRKDLPGNRDREDYEGKALVKCAAVMAPSKSVMDLTMAHYGETSSPCAVFANPMRVKPPVDEATFDAENPLKILFVGRFDTHKGGDIAIDAFHLLAERRADATLTFAGPDIGVPVPGGGVLSIEQRLANLPDAVRQRIDYLGPQPKAHIDTLRRSHACTIVPSRFENFSATLTEAMACGSAVVASDVGGLPEAVTHEETGLLVPPVDPEALAAALERLVDDRVLARTLGAAARTHIEATLSPEKIASDLAVFLKQVMDDYRPAGGQG